MKNEKKKFRLVETKHGKAFICLYADKNLLNLKDKPVSFDYMDAANFLNNFRLWPEKCTVYTNRYNILGGLMDYLNLTRFAKPLQLQ